MKNNTIRLNISGDFITELARLWFYKEGKPYEEIENMLLHCLVNNSLTLEERKAIAMDIVLGRQKLTGDTLNNTYRLVSDNSTRELLISVSKQIQKLMSDLQDANKCIQELTDKYYDLYNGLAEQSIEDVEHQEHRELLQSVLRVVPDVSMDSITKITAKSTDDEVPENSYGWLSPNGEFTPAPFGEHEGWAYNYVRKNNLTEEYDDWYDRRRRLNQINPKSAYYNQFNPDMGDYGDFLVYQKGFVLIHSPYGGLGQVTMNEEKPLTKKQREFLFDYYTKYKKDDVAKDFLKSEE